MQNLVGIFPIKDYTLWEGTQKTCGSKDSKKSALPIARFFMGMNDTSMGVCYNQFSTHSVYNTPNMLLATRS